jgi:hypothetical protein
MEVLYPEATWWSATLPGWTRLWWCRRWRSSTGPGCSRCSWTTSPARLHCGWLRLWSVCVSVLEWVLEFCWRRLLVVRFFVHLTARAMAAGTRHPALFLQVSVVPDARPQGTKFPTMADGALNMVQDGGRRLLWGQAVVHAPNGHPFAIGNCGGATQESKCPECGEAIGGSGPRAQSALHQLQENSLTSAISNWR